MLCLTQKKNQMMMNFVLLVDFLLVFIRLQAQYTPSFDLNPPKKKVCKMVTFSRDSSSRGKIIWFMITVAAPKTGSKLSKPKVMEIFPTDVSRNMAIQLKRAVSYVWSSLENFTKVWIEWILFGNHRSAREN